MRLAHIKVSNYRSFVGDHEFDLAEGVNYFVGPNNCGKSNLISAVELALTADKAFVPQRDRPASTQGIGAPPKTRITLTFVTTDSSSPQRTLIERAREYEEALRKKHKRETRRKGSTFAEDGEIRRVVTFGAQGSRQVSYEAKALGAVSLPADSPEHQRLESQFDRVVRFGVLHSGEDLRSVLSGQFREVLQLVIRDHLGTEQRETEELREHYVAGLKTTLLAPLKRRLQEDVSAMFPEIEIVDLLPEVPSLDETLSSVGVELGDAATTALTGKGTGLRGAVLVAMLQYLADKSKRSLILAVEEPEAFLHPAAQERIAEHLHILAARPEVSLLVTTHSPHVISRQPSGLITELRKTADGYTGIAATARCDEDRAELLGSLYRDSGFAKVLDRATSVPQGTRAVVVTEGYTDEQFLRYGLAAAGRLELIEGIHFAHAGGAKEVAAQAVLTASATQVPVLALLDHDEHGRAAVTDLTHFHWRKNEEIISLRDWPRRCKDQSHDIEIEDLIPSHIAGIVSEALGEDAYDATQRCGSRMHYYYSDAWKKLALERLPRELKGESCEDLVWLGEEINMRIARMVERAERRQHRRPRGDRP
ncbi:Chromosome partition protein Smc [Mycobacterium marinum]|uniref:Chromosome partition protein Smc n=1 Tax=Mycobacterium marinum TaxID=1781 RepID=A0A3E2MPM4_MYCMR|nr:AAA family ATPase [Mycobacterium marinum]RFZ34006.1 Chromosome partition protein Smc [Mycobacterium marinum]